ncbi:MAG: transporter substrate-binding protein [Gimesia chilikensis]|uniref:transporter substrate-binding protein n=1 Tax=Gimesia chilikensis TaxID=2605989 RepID=UPI0037A06828
MNQSSHNTNSQSANKEDFDATRIVNSDTKSEKAGSQSDPNRWIGQQLGKYEITELLGVGGMGVVLKAYDPSIERDVAIKLLHSDVSVDEPALGRFLAEAKSAGKLSHANIVTIYEIAQEGETYYLVMEYVSGGSVESYLQAKGAFPVADATRMMIEACKGLSIAHSAGLVHRDIKPANLMLTRDGTLKISDFGLAKQTSGTALQMTQAGMIVGTPYFMSPEQCEAREVDARSDVYSLGATYYSLLTGKSPYEDSGSVMQVLYAHCNSPAPDPREIQSGVPSACAKIIERAMAIDPVSRYQSAEAMRYDLEAVLAAISGAGVQLPSESGSSLPANTDRTKSASGRFSLTAGITGLLIIFTAIALLLAYRGEVSGITNKESGESKQHQTILPPTGEPITVGILHSLSGTMADSESPVIDATLLAIEELNNSGGLLGRPVKAVVVDGRSDSATFAEETKHLIKNEGVCTVFGCWTSDSRKTVVPIFEEHNHLLIYPVQYEGIEESPNVIYTGAAPNQQIIPAVKWAYAFENKRKFFLIGSDYVFPRVAHEIIKDQLKILGAEIVGNEFLPLGSSEVQPVIDKIIKAKPDVILNCLNGNVNTAFFSGLRKAGITADAVPAISFSIGEEELNRMDTSSMTGDYAAWNYFQSIDSDENKKFIAAVHKKYGEKRVITDPMEAAYFGVKLWAQAVTEAKTTTPAAIRRAILNQRTMAPGGLVRIDPATQHTFKTPRIGKVSSDGTFEIVWTAAKPEIPTPYPSTRSTEAWRALLHDLYSNWGNRWSAPAN